jgi:hypothetical protein
VTRSIFNGGEGAALRAKSVGERVARGKTKVVRDEKSFFGVTLPGAKNFAEVDAPIYRLGGLPCF